VTGPQSHRVAASLLALGMRLFRLLFRRDAAPEGLVLEPGWPPVDERARAAAEEIGADNDQFVGGRPAIRDERDARVTVLAPQRSMAPAAAIRHAAWLVALAEITDPDVEGIFPHVLRAVRNR
jgi:hypothetical protein